MKSGTIAAVALIIGLLVCVFVIHKWDQAHVIVTSAKSRPTNIQTAQPLLATVHIRVPLSLLPTDAYWVYVNGQLVSAQQHASTRAGTAEFDTITQRLFPGSYTFEMLVPIDSGGLPFTVKKLSCDCEAGKTIELELPPPNTSISMPMGSLYAEPRPGGTWSQFLADRREDLQRAEAAYESAPLSLALSNVCQSFRLTPPLGPIVYIELPETLGGSREFDSVQVTRMINYLRAVSSMDVSRAAEGFDRAPAEFRPAIDEYLAMVRAHNERFNVLMEIPAKLEKAKKARSQ